MKLFSFLVACLSLLISVNSVSAQNNPRSCACSASVTGPDCNVSQTAAFDLGSQVSVNDVLNAINLQNCAVKDAIPPGIGIVSLNLDEDACNNANFTEQFQNYDLTVSCQLSNEVINANPQNPGNSSSNNSSRTFGNPDPAPIIPLINPIGGSAEDPQGQTNISQIVGNIIKVALGIIGSITLGIFVYGGFLWLTSAGNSEKVSQGSSAMLYAVIGLFIIFGAYAILNTIISGIRSGASGGIGSLQVQNSNSTTTQPQTAAEICKGLNRDACTAAAPDGCTYVVFVLPQTNTPLSECAPNEERDTACRRYLNICKSGNEEDDQALADCAEEYALCARK